MRLIRIPQILMALAASAACLACDEPPEKAAPSIDVDAESSALERQVDKVRDEADERLTSPPADASTQSPTSRPDQ